MDVKEERIYCLEPIINHRCKVLIIGTMPGGKSLTTQTYYANPNNHFWDFMYRILDASYPPYKVFNTETPKEERYNLLLSNGIGLWDVVADCYRNGNSDKDIIDPHFNDIAEMVNRYQIRHLVCAKPLVKQFLEKDGQLSKIKANVLVLNSTSSQNPQNIFGLFAKWKSTLDRVLK